MSMTELVQIIEDQGKGVRSYVECARTARERIKTQSENAAAYYVLAIAADKFVDAYDDQPLLSQHAEDEFVHYKSYVERLETAAAQADEGKKLDTLNRVAADVANHKLM